VAPFLGLDCAGRNQTRAATARSNLRSSPGRPFPLKFARLSAAAAVVGLASGIFVPSSTETAVANGDTRTLNLYHSHTGESIQATFRVNGAYDPAVLQKLNYFLRDWRNNDQTRMDPRLFDVIWEVYRTAGATQPVVIVSAYRSPQTNAMLRRRSRGVAEHSQHILGRAMDTTMPGMPMERIREIGMRLQRGGVGWYPSSNFVHLDVGGVRAWPRMSYDQLARLFPDGKTVHLAADGRTLPRYAEARAEIASRGGVVSDVPQSGPAGRFFAWLFGKHDEDEAADQTETAARQAPSPAQGRRGATEFAALPANGTGPVAANLTAATPAKAQQRAEENPARVAQLEPAPHLRGTAEENSSEKEGAAAAQSVPGKIDQRAVSFAAVPLPPPRPGRPSREVKLVFADVPTPPMRPASLARGASSPANEARAEKSQPASAAANNSLGDDLNLSLAQAANLPVVITNGPKDQQSAPKQVLAFAPDAPLQNPFPNAPSTPPSGPADKPAAQQSNAGAVRSDRPRLRSPSNNLKVGFPVPSILGQSPTGLRLAARLIPGALSNKPLAEDYAFAFGTIATDLDPNRFTGAAVRPLTLAQGVVRLNQQPAPVREN
jgi:uncharacterized protein YcbK (DUF882 family)